MCGYYPSIIFLLVTVCIYGISQDVSDGVAMFWLCRRRPGDNGGAAAAGGTNVLCAFMTSAVTLLASAWRFGRGMGSWEFY